MGKITTKHMVRDLKRLNRLDFDINRLVEMYWQMEKDHWEEDGNPENHILELPTIYGTLLLNDTLTGHPIISMDCAKLTSYRTAAVSALAAKHLTINNTVRTLTFIGCGYQAKLHAKMYAATFPNIDTIKLYDRNRDNAYKFSQWLISKSIGNAWKVTNDIRTACSNTDVITTLTPTTEPFLGQSHIFFNKLIIYHFIINLAKFYDFLLI